MAELDINAVSARWHPVVNPNNINTLEVDLGDYTSSQRTDWFRVIGFSRIAVIIDNGATNAIDFTIQGSFNGTNWFTVANREGANSSYSAASRNVLADEYETYWVSEDDVYRFLAVNITTANANGTNCRLILSN